MNTTFHITSTGEDIQVHYQDMRTLIFTLSNPHRSISVAVEDVQEILKHIPPQTVWGD